MLGFRRESPKLLPYVVDAKFGDALADELAKLNPRKSAHVAYARAVQEKLREAIMETREGKLLGSLKSVLATPDGQLSFWVRELMLDLREVEDFLQKAS